jgi:molybdate-binding protein
MKNYYVCCDLGEGIPSYDFVVRAESLDEAVKKAEKIINTDYPENWKEYNDKDFSCHEITAEQLLERLTIN